MDAAAEPPLKSVNERDRLLAPTLLADESDAAAEESQRFAFDLAFAYRFVLIFRAHLAPSPWHWLCIAAIALSSLMYSVVSSKIGDLLGEFYTVVTTPHTTLEALRVLLISLGATMVAQAVVQTCVVSFARALAVHVRRRVTESLHELYYTDRNYYKISLIEEFKNPDQRIAQDIEKFARSYTDVLQKVIASPVFVVFFWIRVSKMLHWTAPLGIVAYYCFGYLVQRFVMSPIVHHVYLQERLEGEFRRIHSSQHAHAEAIAMYRGDTVERRLSARTFDCVLDNAVTIVKWEWFLTFLSYLFSYLGTLVGYMVVALPLIMNWSKALESNYVTTGLYDLGMLSWGFTQLTLVTADLSEFAGYSSRVGLLLETLLGLDSKKKEEDDASLQEAELGAHKSRTESSALSDGLSFSNLEITDPVGSTLLRDGALTLTSNTLVMGSAGSGKTSLFRVIAGLWNDFRGTITLHPEVVFVPQDVYLPVANLSQQLCYPRPYPDNTDRFTTQKIRQVLKTFGLESLLKLPKVHAITDWSFLSPGQKQKLVMARLLLQRPKFVLVDEITSDVDDATEALFYRLCKENGMRVLSIGHRTSLRRYHEVVLELKDAKLVAQTKE